MKWTIFQSMQKSETDFWTERVVSVVYICDSRKRLYITHYVQRDIQN